MSTVVDLIDETESVSEELRNLLMDVLKQAASAEGVPEQAELSVTLTDNETIQEINSQYRGLDKPTDVISFALNEGEQDHLQADMPELLGDIVISLEKAEEQADTYGHSLKREMAFLAVHGLLHLLGYTHDEPEQERKMFSRQESILSDYGLQR
ncbi:rRNA maturation RNase YbeY [Salibacterium halotolerans]|uniref:Endoribonuclease YbeY n=1 Tax=Salibacterium halotolerans TaxID=1884432 RepID=A0A1I5NGN1_9BACI|nr:rRNA maturation RNase YbeY [Salibacterium halotolerans]SFP20850.1 probable rRNA maturation factor [Salibacterium halotolerans]